MVGVQEARQSGSSGLTSQIHLKPLVLEARAWDPAWGRTDVLWEETRGVSSVQEVRVSPKAWGRSSAHIRTSGWWADDRGCRGGSGNSEEGLSGLERLKQEVLGGAQGQDLPPTRPLNTSPWKAAVFSSAFSGAGWAGVVVVG